MRISKKKLQQYTIGLVATFAALTAGLTVGSRYLNQKHEEEMQAQYAAVKVEKSDEVIVNATDPSYEEVLTSGDISYDKIGDNIYVVKNVSENEMEIINSMETASVETNVPFVVSADETTVADAEGEGNETIADRQEELPEGYTWKQLAQERGQKLVAVIDTGINNYAIHSKDFTGTGIEDNNGHGTYVASLIDGNSDGKAMILSLKAMNDNGIGYLSSVMKAVQYAREQGADIINMSVVTDIGDGKESFVQLIKDVMAEGITVVASAGNYQSDVKYYLPAGIDGVISVGAVDEEGRKTFMSNFGDVTYYEKAGSTSEASAIVTGKLVAGTDLSENITKETVVIEEGTIVDEPVKVAESGSETDEFVVSLATQTFNVNFTEGQGHGYIRLASNRSDTSEIDWDYSSNGSNNLGINNTRATLWVKSVHPDTGYYLKYKILNGGTYGSLQIWPNDTWYDVGGLQFYPTPGVNLTVTVSITPRSYTLKLDPNGGKTYAGSTSVETKDPKLVTDTSNWCNVGAATRTNYTFLGYYTQKEGGVQVFDETGYAVSGTGYWSANKGYCGNTDLTVYAHWKLNTTTVDVDATLGTINGTQTASITQNVGSTWNATATPPTYTVTYDSAGGTACGAQTSKPTLASWSHSGGGSINNTTKVFTFGDSNATLKANWTYGSITLPTPSRTGYTFKGWTSNGTNRLTGSYTVTGSVKLTAVWQINSYKVNFYDGYSGALLKTQTVNYGSGATAPANPTRTGYTFAGWDRSFSSITAATNVYATWTANKYTVVFNKNTAKHVFHGASTDAPGETTQRPSGTMSNQSFTYDAAQRLTSCGFSWAGHTFLGWSTDPKATSATYTNTKSVSNLTATNGGTVTLYAIWSANSYSLTVNPAYPNGTWNSSGSSQTATNAAGAATEWGDRVALGQATPADRSVTITYNANGSGASVGRSYDISKWIFDKWIVSSGSNGHIFNNGQASCYYILENTSDSVEATYFYQTVTLPSASRPGYTFMGWYYDAECTRKAMGRDGSNGNAGSIFRPTESVTLYARWVKTTFNYDETVSAYMMDGTTADKSVYIRKIDSRDNRPIVTTASGSSAIIGIYRGSNLILKLDTKTGILNPSNNAVLISRTNADSLGFYNITPYLTVGNTYTMKEIQAPDGYLLETTSIPFYYDGSKRIQISMKNTSLGEPNPPGTPSDPWAYTLKSVKVNPDGDLVAGAKFTLKNETTGQVKETFTTGTDGVICEDFSKYLSAGNRYSLSETSAPEGYQLASPIYFTAPSSEADYAALPDFTVVDQYKRFNLVISKENSDGQPLQGATFQIFMKDADGDLEPVYMSELTNSYVKDKKEPNAVKAILTTGSDGTITLKNLPLRANYTGSEADYTKSYYIKEIAAPAGYNPLPEVMEILVPDNGNTTFVYTATDESIVLTLETGGLGTKLFMFSGCAMISLAIIASALKKRRRA